MPEPPERQRGTRGPTQSAPRGRFPNAKHGSNPAGAVSLGKDQRWSGTPRSPRKAEAVLGAEGPGRQARSARKH
eukprot:12989323-Alexandrium_andersonii.AAC.1